MKLGAKNIGAGILLRGLFNYDTVSQSISFLYPCVDYRIIAAGLSGTFKHVLC